MITETDPIGIITYSRTRKDGIKLYQAEIETTLHDHSPRNPSLPVKKSTYGKDNKPTVAYDLTYIEALTHIRSFGFSGKIKKQ